MKLYNVLTRSIEAFEPRDPEAVTVYVCGITPYDTTHLGHAFTYTAFDILIRYLEFRGYGVRYVQNVTDVDDDILRKAQEVYRNWKELGDRWTAHFIRDMQALNVRPPDYFPRATDVISEIIATVEDLLEAGVAYESSGSVYFRVGAWPEYGKLSRIPRDEMLPIANERGNIPDDPNKKDPLDFVLWQAQKPGEPAWDSPWGAGRPGWHIECSSMATHYLGNTIDVHGGGGDLIFPHHESEIAQSECATGEQPFVRFWLHTAMVRCDGEKMSKSLGNLVMARDLLESYSPDAVRLYLGRHHYRKPWDHDVEALDQALALAEKLRQASVAAGGRGTPLDPGSDYAAFVAAMDDDLNTPIAVDVLQRLAEAVLAGAEAAREIKAAQDALWDMAQIFGLRLNAEEPDSAVVAGWDAHLKRFVPEDEPKTA